jgi:hypothetical protein
VGVGSRLRASIGASGLALLVLATSAPAAASAAGLAAVVTDGTLRVTGGSAAEQITLRVNALDRSKLLVDVDGSELSFDLGTFAAIDIDAGSGDDTVRIDESVAVFTTTKATRIEGGNGDDRLLGGAGAEVLSGGRGDDFIDGNGGVDTAFLGQGDDTFVWDPGDASDIVEGQAGFDTMIFNGSIGNEIMAATAVDGRVLFTRNLGTIVMDLDDVEAIDVRALGGSDSVTVNDVTQSDLQRVDVDLATALDSSSSDGLADTVTVAGTKGDDAIAATADGAAVEVSGLAALVRITHADADKDTLVIDGGTGDDAVSVDPAVTALIKFAVL